MNREVYKDLEVETRFDEEKCWTVFTFFKKEKEVGFIHIDINKETRFGFIFGINSYESGKGTGTKMITFLSDKLQLQLVSGDADPDSIGFWNKFNPIWKDESFELWL